MAELEFTDPVSSFNLKEINEFLDALGIVGDVTNVVLELSVDSCVEVRITKLVDKKELSKLSEVLSKYNLVKKEVERPKVNTTTETEHIM